MKAGEYQEPEKTVCVRLGEWQRMIVSEVAARNRQSLEEFMLEAALTYADALTALRDHFGNLLQRRMVSKPVQPQAFCRKCGKELSPANNSGYCRKCQRTYSLKLLKKRFGEGKQEGEKPPVRSKDVK